MPRIQGCHGIMNRREPSDLPETKEPIPGPKADAWGDRGVLWILLLYFSGMAFLRLMISPTAGLDEAEQLLFTQRWQWGYGPQPPLYTWLQILIFEITGVSVLGLSVLKNALLFGIFLFAFRAARQLLCNRRAASIVVWSLFFLPHLSWEAQRELTHTVLVTCVAAATWVAVLGLINSGHRLRYLSLGFCVGLGLLSNYSYALLLSGLAVAVFWDPVLRQRFASPKIFWFASSAAACVALHLYWAIQNPHVVTKSVQKLEMAREHAWLVTAAKGLGNVIQTWADPLMLLGVLFVVLIGWRGLSMKSLFQNAMSRPPVRLVWRTLAANIVLLAIGVLISGASNLKERWLTPLFLAIPLLFAALRENQLSEVVYRRFQGLAFVIMVFTAMLLAGRVWFAEWSQRPVALNAPLSQLVDTWRPQILPGDVILAENTWLAGNLRLLLPGHAVMTPREPGLRLPVTHGRGWVIWDQTRSEAVPDALTTLLDELGAEIETGSIPISMEAPLRHFSQRTLRLNALRFRAISK